MTGNSVFQRFQYQNSSIVFKMALLLIPLNIASAGTKDIQVFEVRKNLQLSPAEPIYHDYYVNAGTNQGLKPGMLVQVFRRVPVHDNFGSAGQEDLSIPIATLRLIHVQKTLSVARRVKEKTRATFPVLDIQTVMTGDRIDLSSEVSGDLEHQPADGKSQESRVEPKTHGVSQSESSTKPSPPEEAISKSIDAKVETKVDSQKPLTIMPN